MEREGGGQQYSKEWVSEEVRKVDDITDERLERQ